MLWVHAPKFGDVFARDKAAINVDSNSSSASVANESDEESESDEERSAREQALSRWQSRRYDEHRSACDVGARLQHGRCEAKESDVGARRQHGLCEA